MILEMINSLRLTSFYYLLTKKHIIEKNISRQLVIINKI
jgi:hypothetical protein